MARVKRSLLTLLSGSGLSVGLALLAFVTTPLLVHWLGDVEFGAFRASLDWFGYVQLLEFGIGGALTPLFAKALASDDRSQVVSVARAGLRAYWPIAWVMLVASLGLGFVLPYLLKLPLEYAWHAWLGGFAFACAALLLPLATFKPYLEAAQEGFTINKLLLVQSIMLTSLSLLFAGLGFGLAGQFVAYVLGTATFPLALGMLAWRRLPELRQHDRSTASHSEVWSLSWPTFGFNLCSRLSLLTDNIILAAFLGPAAVAPFFLTQRVIALAGSQAQGVSTATWAGLMDFYLRGEVEHFRHRLLQLTRLATLAGVALVGPIAIWNAHLIQNWVGPTRFAGELITWLAAGNAIMLSTFSMLGWPFVAAGKVRVVLPWAILNASVNLTLSLILTWQFGTAGPLWGTFLTFTFINWPATLYQLRTHFQVPPHAVLLAFSKPLFAGAVYLLCWWGLQAWLPLAPEDSPKWVRLGVALAWAGLGTLGFLPVGWYLGLTTADRLEWGTRLRAWLNRKRTNEAENEPR